MDNTLKYRGYQAEIKYSIPDKCLYGKIADISDLVTFEGNETNIVNEFHNAVEGYLIFCEENHKEPAQPVCKTIIEVPDNISLEEAVEYAQEHIDDIPVAINAEYVPNSDNFELEDCDFEEDLEIYDEVRIKSCGDSLGTIFAIEETVDASGVVVQRTVHFFGYGYFIEDAKNPCRFLEYTFFYAPLKDVVDMGFSNVEDRNSDQYKQYITDCDEAKLEYIYNTYDNGNAPKITNEITEDMPAGTYVLV